jgi:uroporphyrinogen decarboxylase
VDPVILFAERDAITAAVQGCLAKAGTSGHILNLGHGVLVGTPEESVAHMFELSKQMLYEKALV